MITNDLPRITKLPVGTAEVVSEELLMGNYQTAYFVFDTVDTVTVKVIGSNDNEDEKDVKFLYKKNGDKEFIESKEIELTDAGTWIVQLTADSLASENVDRVTLKITGADDDIVVCGYSFQTQPRYSDLDE